MVFLFNFFFLRGFSKDRNWFLGRALNGLQWFRQQRILRVSRATGNERPAVNSTSFPRMYSDMEAQIHHLEQEAYCAVLRAFKAQSDALTWEKEGLITELRKELRVSDDEHRELLTRVNADDIISKIREWRKLGGNQVARHNTSQAAYDVLPSPGLLSSRKKQKTSQPGHQFPGLSSMKSMQSPTGPALSRPFMNRSNSGVRATTEPAEASNVDALVGRKLWTRWPEDNNFYEAIVTAYNPAEIPPEDIQWEGEDPGLPHGGGHGGQARGPKKPSSRGGPGTGRGRPMKSQPKKDFLPAQNGNAQRVSDDIELLNTDALVKEVETVFSTNHPDPFELEKAKKMLKDHEQALIDAIAKLAYASDGESDGEHPFTSSQSMERELGKEG